MKNFNVENRAQKVLQSEAPRPAPRHPSTAAAFDNLTQEHPEYLDEQKKKHKKLDEYLKNVRVNSKGQNPEIVTKSDRHLPENRRRTLLSDYGFTEPEVIPEGRASLRQALNFIAQHHLSPKDNSADTIAEQYKLNTTHVQNILKYFQTFHMHIPKEMLAKNPKLLDSMQANPAHSQSIEGMQNVMKLGAGLNTVAGQKKN